MLTWKHWLVTTLRLQFSDSTHTMRVLWIVTSRDAFRFLALGILFIINFVIIIIIIIIIILPIDSQQIMEFLYENTTVKITNTLA